jgi:signal transduction histidine kinase
MPFASRYRRRRDPYVYAIAAIVCAAAVVLSLQQRAIGDLRRQTTLVLQEIAAQTAQAVVADVRETLDGPVYDTLTAVNHPQIRDGRLDLLAAEYAEGLAAYPHVERFFVWTEQTEARVPGEVLFLGPGHDEAAAPASGSAIQGPFARDPGLGHAILALAERASPAQQIYAAFGQVAPDGRHDVFLRLFWTDARRDRFFAVTGFVIDRQQFREQFIAELHRRHLDRILKVRGEDLPFTLRVSDEHGSLVWGSPDPQPLAVRVGLPVLFYPAQMLGSRLAVGIEPVTWTVEVGPADPDRLVDVTAHGYWLPGLSLLLMFIALTLTVQAGRRAAATARMQADFVSHVSHQLKTPLSLLRVATETVELDRVRSPEKLAQYLATIKSEVGRLTSLVQRILEFSSVQERPPLEFDTVDLQALVRETVEAFQASLGSQHFRFRVREDGPAPAVQADSAALEQVLANLLDNAVKYSGAVREVTVRVGWSSNRATVDVTDSGIGIPPADRGRVFDKFYRGSGEAHHRQGFGLGLTIARELVEAHGGRLDLHSSGVQGSTFRITLPATVLSPASVSEAVELTP